MRRVAGARWPFSGASDHGVSEALYLNDPDGLGIEIYADRPRERWARPPRGGGVTMTTEPLDLEDLLAQSPGEPARAVEPGTAIGHVHLKVADVAPALRFYETLGFERQALLPSAAFVSAGGYHHHIGLNSWQSAAGVPAPSDAPGLRELVFALSGDEQLRELAARVDGGALDEGGPGGGERVSVTDPDGEQLAFEALAAG